MKKGVLGVTNNMANSLSNFPKKLSLDKEIEIKANSYEEVSLQTSYINYLNKDSKEKLTAVPLFIKEEAGCAKIIFQARYVSGQTTPKFNAVLFSDVITVRLIKEEKSSNKNNYNWLPFVIIPAAVIVALIPLPIILVKRRKTK